MQYLQNKEAPFKKNPAYLLFKKYQKKKVLQMEDLVWKVLTNAPETSAALAGLSISALVHNPNNNLWLRVKNSKNPPQFYYKSLALEQYLAEG